MFHQTIMCSLIFFIFHSLFSFFFRPPPPSSFLPSLILSLLLLFLHVTVSYCFSLFASSLVHHHVCVFSITLCLCIVAAMRLHLPLPVQRMCVWMWMTRCNSPNEIPSLDVPSPPPTPPPFEPQTQIEPDGVKDEEEDEQQAPSTPCIQIHLANVRRSSEPLPCGLLLPPRAVTPTETVTHLTPVTSEQRSSPSFSLCTYCRC